MILPLTVLRRLDCVLEPTKPKVLAKHAELRGKKLENLDPQLRRASGFAFYNTSANLTKKISSIVERPKESWPHSFIRKIADELIKVRAMRKTSPMHESRWLNLTGFASGRDLVMVLMSSGLHRVVWKMYTNRPMFPANAQVRSEWWILWRRVAGGLKPGQQRQFIQDLTPVMMTGKGEKSKIPSQEFIEIWMAVANMEKLLVKDKIKLGRQLLAVLKPKTSAAQLFWSLSRIGAATGWTRPLPGLEGRADLVRDSRQRLPTRP